jgi:hypothetical protein
MARLGGSRKMDPILSIERIAHALDAQFGGRIDLSDLRPDMSAEDQRCHFLTRALAGFCLCGLTECDT